MTQLYMTLVINITIIVILITIISYYYSLEALVQNSSYIRKNKRNSNTSKIRSIGFCLPLQQF